MEIKIPIDDIKASIKDKVKERIFSGANADDSILTTPANGSCSRKYTILYDTDYAVAATSTGNLSTLLSLAAGVLSGVVTGNAGTIINGLQNVDEALNDIIDTERATEPVEIRLKAKLCALEADDEKLKEVAKEIPKKMSKKIPKEEIIELPQERQIRAALEVTGQWIITDADPSDDSESAEINLQLSVDGKPFAAERYFHRRRTKRPVDFPIKQNGETINFIVDQCAKVSNEEFMVVAKVSATSTTNGAYYFLNSASIIRIDNIQLIVEEVPVGAAECAEK